MILPPLPLIDNCLFIDNSGWIESICLCHRLAQYKNLNRRIAAGEKSALNFGGAFHLAMEYRYRNYLNKPVDDKYYNNMATILTKHFDEHPTPADDWRTLNLCMDLVKRYNQRYENEAFNLLVDKDNNPLVELAFAVPMFFINQINGKIRPFVGDTKCQIDEILIIYSGRIDLPISLEGQVYVLDFKTAGMMGPMFFDGKRLSGQPRGYAWAFQKTTGTKVHGYVIRGILTKEVPEYVRSGKSIKRGTKTFSAEQWWQDSFQEERFILKPNELDEWEQNTIALVEEFMWHYRRNYMPMRVGNEHACVNYGKCQYYEVCRLASEDRNVMLNSGLYTNNVWSPLKQITQNKP